MIDETTTHSEAEQADLKQLDWLSDLGYRIGILWPGEMETPEGYFIFRVATAIGRDLDSGQEYGVQMSFTERPITRQEEHHWPEWLRMSLQEYERDHSVERFEHEFFYREEIVPIPDEELVDAG